MSQLKIGSIYKSMYSQNRYLIILDFDEIMVRFYHFGNKVEGLESIHELNFSSFIKNISEGWVKHEPE